MIKKTVLALLLGAFVFGQLGCGERPIVNYKQGKYQGKKDMQPWDNAQFKGDRMAWENAEKARAQDGNEYNRIN